MSQQVGLTYEEFIKGISAVGFKWSPDDMCWKLGNEIIADEALRNFIRTWPNLTIPALDLVRRFKRGFSVSFTPKGDKVHVVLGLPGQTENLPAMKSCTEQQAQMGRELHALVSSWQVGVPYERAKRMIAASNPEGVIGAGWVRIASKLLSEHQQAVLTNRNLVQDGEDMLKSALGDEEPEE